jgi:hypothetical protein
MAFRVRDIRLCKAHIYGKRPAILFLTGIGWEEKLAFLVSDGEPVIVVDGRVFVGFDPSELEGMVPSLF